MELKKILFEKRLIELGLVKPDTRRVEIIFRVGVDELATVQINEDRIAKSSDIDILAQALKELAEMSREPTLRSGMASSDILTVPVAAEPIATEVVETESEDSRLIPACHGASVEDARHDFVTINGHPTCKKCLGPGVPGIGRYALWNYLSVVTCSERHEDALVGDVRFCAKCYVRLGDPKLKFPCVICGDALNGSVAYRFDAGYAVTCKNGHRTHLDPNQRAMWTRWLTIGE